MKRGAPVLILLALCLPLLGSGKRSDGVLVSFHAEGTKEEWPKFAQAVKMSDGKQYYFRILPVVTDANVAWYYPFIAPDKTFGVAFKLDSRGTNALTSYTSSPENHGQLLAAVVHPISQQIGGVRSYLQIDKRVTDGIIVIWSGLTDKHLRVFSARYPHVRDLMGDQGQ